MDFLSKLLQGIAFVPSVVNGPERKIGRCLLCQLRCSLPTR